MHMSLPLTIAATLLVAAAQAQLPTPPPPSVDVQTVGPQIGTKIPEFTLPDQRGTPRSLNSLMGPKGLVLVFFRSADW